VNENQYSFILISAAPELAHQTRGGFSQIMSEVLITVSKDVKIQFDFNLYDKTVTRTPESQWISFQPQM